MPVLRTHALTKSYSGRTVVRGVSLEVSAGEVVGLLGPNGAGKTTTFYMVVGLTSPGLRPRRARRRRPHARPDVRAGAQGHRLPAAGAVDLPRPHGRAQHPRHSRDARPRSRARASAGCASCSPSSASTHLAKSKAYTLSGGERRRVEITRALVISPQFILLDEPFAGIDPIAVTDIQKIIFHLKARGIGVLITDHNVRETLKITDRAHIVHDGDDLPQRHARGAGRRRGGEADLSWCRFQIGLGY